MVVYSLELSQSPQDQGGSLHPLSTTDREGAESGGTTQDDIPLAGLAFQGVTLSKVAETPGLHCWFLYI